jgi:hypothetical protein
MTEEPDISDEEGVRLFTKEIAPRLDHNMTMDEIAEALNIGVDQVKKIVSQWRNPYCTKEGPALFKRTRETIARHYYFDKPWHYVVAALFVLESKCSQVLPVVFYIFFGGSKGSGKTNILDLLRILTGGVMCENISVKALAETMKSAPAVFIDEIDADRGDLTDIRNAMLRQGYKKTAAPYTRWDVKTNSIVEVPIYGPKAATFRGLLKDDAMLDRGFVISTAKAKGKEAYSYVLMNFWPDVGTLPEDLTTWGLEVRRRLDNEKLKEIAFSSAFKEKVAQAVQEIGANRESELISIAVLVSMIADVDVIKELREATESRPVSDESIAGELEELQQVILDLAVQLHQTAIDESRIIRFKQSEIKKELNRRRVSRGERSIFDYRFSILREELGIDRSMLTNPGNAMHWDVPEEVLHTMANKTNLVNIQKKPGQQEDEVSQVDQVRQMHKDADTGMPFDELVSKYGLELVEREKMPKIGGR